MNMGINMNFDIKQWLASIRLAEYSDMFVEQGFDRQGLAEITDADLRELGLSSMGHRKIFLREAARLGGGDNVPSSIERQTIFLSYAHRSERDEDFDVSEDLVLLIQAELQRDGHTVWIDREGIRAGSQWRERITAAILAHAHFLSFLSSRSVRDPGVCLNEIATALGASKNIQTVLAQDERCVAPPLTISHIQWHDFQYWREIRAGTKTGSVGENWDTWFDQRMTGVRETLSSGQNARVSGELQKLRDILDPSSFEARIVEKTKNFYGRQWLFDAAQDWLDNSTSRMFWLKGSPGIGKSAFAAKLAHQARSAVIGFFMCDFQGRKDPEESAREAICTLAFQIASRLPDYRLKLLHQMHVDKDKVNKRSADDLFEFLITEPLNRSGKIPESTRLCLVIDALDEAGRSSGGNALVELLAKHAERLPDWLGVLVTSRPEPYLEQMLKTLSGTFVDGQSAQNRQDLAEWIDRRLPVTLQGVDRQRVVEAVLDKSGGTFLYLSLVEKDETLDLADPQALPDKLDGFFKQTFNRYFPDPEAYGKKTEPFLRLMAAAPGPLPSEMGRQILGWSQRELVLNVINPMGSLLQERDGGMVFFHASLADWVKDISRSGNHCVDGGGQTQLGRFIWDEFENSAQSPWRAQILNWIAEFGPHTKEWHQPSALSAAAKFLEINRRFMPARSLRKQVLRLTSANSEISALIRKNGSKNEEVASAMEALAENYIESAIGDEGRWSFDDPIKLLETAWKIRCSASGPTNRLTLLTLSRIPYGEAARYADGRKALEQVLQNSSALSAEEVRKVQAHYAYYLYEGGNFEESHKIYERLLEHCAPSSIERATALCLMGFIEFELNHWNACRASSEQALVAINEVHTSADLVQLIATTKLNLAMSLSALGMHSESIRTATEAEASFAITMADSCPWWGSIWTDIALIYFAMGDLKNASKLAEKAAAISEFGLGEVHYEPTCAWMLQAWFCLHGGDHERGMMLLERTIKVRVNTLPPGHWRTLLAEENMAFAYRLLGDVRKADAIALRWSAQLPDDFSTHLSWEASVRVLCRTGTALWRNGSYSLARRLIKGAIDRCKGEGRLDLSDRLTRVYDNMTREIGDE